LDDWIEALDENLQIYSVYFDFAKAFDTVPHKRLLHKLSAYGITGKLHQWIQSFLLDRKQRVVINGNTVDSGYNELIGTLKYHSLYPKFVTSEVAATC
jgi:hypothetical protein